MSRLMCIAFMFAAACGPSTRNGGDDGIPSGPCDPGDTVSCYTGQDGTKGVGPCHQGKSTCDPSGTWGPCDGEVKPTGETCTDGVDNNCNGAVDEDEDRDGDGITTCNGDCCDSTECSQPALVNAGAFDAAGNQVDDDCNGVIDDAVPLCDQGIASATGNAMDYARAIDLCQTTTMAEKKWGVIEAKLTLADGNGTPAAKATSVRPRFGTNVIPRGGSSMAVLSTGAAAGKGDTAPAYQSFQDTPEPGNNKQSPFPADYFAANGNKLPNAPGCPGPNGNNAMDPVMLTLTIRVPTNAKSFKLDTNFYSSEFPEYTCSPFNDFFVVLLDSMYQGASPNPTDKNLAFYTPPNSMMKYPVGVNLASGNTGLFTQCVNGRIGCAQLGNGSISTCTSTTDLAGTGFDNADPGTCDANSLEGGGTGWLQTSGNVVPGEIIKVRIAIWDTSDHVLDSLALIDAFTWSVDLSQPGTVIF
jgi:Putative metal-binding motif